MAARGMEGLSDFRKVTPPKKGSFVSASLSAPAFLPVCILPLGETERLGCLAQDNRGLSNDVVTLSVWEFRLSVSTPKGSS